MTAVQTHYDILEISKNASDVVIRAAYKSLSQKYHPDKNAANRASAERVMTSINTAFDVLSDPLKRKEYDASLSEMERSTATLGPRTQELSTQPQPIGVGPPHTRSFLARTWLMFLFVASLVMLLGVFPYTVFAGEFKWPYVAGILFWLVAGKYSYAKLFSSRDA